MSKPTNPSDAELTKQHRMARLREQFKSIKDKMQQADMAVLVLMKHPDATTEDIVQVHAMCANAHAQYEMVRAILRAQYPESRNPITLPFPWNKE